MILNRDKELEFQTVDVKSGKMTVSISPVPKNSTLKEHLTRIIKCGIIRFDNGHPVFAEPFFIRHDIKANINTKTYDVALLHFQNRLIWQIYNSKNKIYERVPIRPCTYLRGLDCLDETTKIFEKKINSNNFSEKERASFLEKYFTVECIIPTLSAKTPWAIQLLPVSRPIDIDERVRISYFSTVVYIIADGRGIKGNHAVIVMKGLNEMLDEYTHTLEFLGKNVVLELDCPSPAYEERTEMHHVSSKKIKELIDGIRKMKELPKFNIMGQNSILGDNEKHNCITWALHIAKEWLEIDFGYNSESRNLFTYTKEFTKKEKAWQKLPFKKSLL